MSKNELQPITHPEIDTRRGGKLIATFANRKVRQYDSYDPRTVIDLMEQDKHIGKIIVDKYPAFETGNYLDVDRVEVIKGHHKARLVFAFGKTLSSDGVLKHEVYSPEGLVGYAYGDNFDYYLASLFYDDPTLKSLADEGQASFDKAVQEYIEEELATPGIFNR